MNDMCNLQVVDYQGFTPTRRQFNFCRKLLFFNVGYINNSHPFYLYFHFANLVVLTLFRVKSQITMGYLTNIFFPKICHYEKVYASNERSSSGVRHGFGAKQEEKG